MVCRGVNAKLPPRPRVGVGGADLN